MLIVTEGRAASRETAPEMARADSAVARWRADGQFTEDWHRAWLQRHAPLDLRGLTPAAGAARSIGAPERDSWLAAPVQLLAGLDRVHLPPTGLLCLETSETAALIDAFNRELGRDGMRLHGLPGGGLLLSGLTAPAAETFDPASVLGRDIHSAVPRGADGAPLRALVGEIEMWLHEHPLNLARRRRGVPAISGLWLWGGGALPGENATLTRPNVAGVTGERMVFGGSDPWLRAVAISTGTAADGFAPDFTTLMAGAALQGVVAVRAQDAQDSLRRSWLEPARAALAARRLGRLTLWVDGKILTLSPSSNWHYWRPARHWLEFIE